MGATLSAGHKCWRVCGRIAGQNLPNAVIRVGSVNVGPLPSGVTGVGKPDINSIRPDAHTYFFAKSGVIDVASECHFWVDRYARTPEEAIEWVEQNEVPLLHTVFTLLDQSTPCQVEIVWTTDGERKFGHFSSSSRFAFWDPQPLTEANARKLDSLYRRLTINSIAGSAARTLSKAIQQEATSGGKSAEQESAILLYYKVIEQIATSITVEPPSDREEKQQAILQRLSKVMSSTKALKKKVSAVHDAQRKLSVLDTKYTALRIQAAADALGLSNEWKKVATQLGKARNRKLGHPGAEMSASERRAWLENKRPDYSAFHLARDMLSAYAVSGCG